MNKCIAFLLGKMLLIMCMYVVSIHTSMDDHRKGAQVFLEVMQSAGQLAGDIYGPPARENASSFLYHVR